MEHRWGERLEVNIPVQVICLHPRLDGNGVLVNLSISGGLITVDLSLRTLSLLQIVVAAVPWTKDSPTLSAYVTRTHGDRVGVEWSAFAPRGVIETLRAAYSHCVPHIAVRDTV
jgi:hypothetical protein